MAESLSNSGSLREVYDEAESVQQSIEDGSVPVAEVQATVEKAIRLYEGCCELIDRISLFSLNEELEEINSSELRYLLCPYNLASLYTLRMTSDRKSTLALSQKTFKSFLMQIEAYGLLAAEDKRAAEAALSGKASGAMGLGGGGDPAARRAVKIARYKREKELERNLEILRSADQSQDENLRSVWSAIISFHATKAVAALEGIAQELEILAYMPPISDLIRREEFDTRAREREGQRGNEYDDRVVVGGCGLPKSGPLLDPNTGKPLRPFVITGDRERLQQSVFGPGYNLPTMSIEEYLAEEERRGNVIKGGGEQSGEQKEEDDDDDEEESDRKMYKAREWDEFVEANPKGAGNMGFRRG
ncbi:TAP42-like [Saitoella coloradoensis]